MAEKKYKNAAEKQRAWRIRHGQKVKVPLEVRRGEKTGSQSGDIRGKKEGETWEAYDKYLKSAILKAEYREKGAVIPPKDKGISTGAKRSIGGYKEPIFPEGYYELREKYERDLEALTEKQKEKKK
jgi:hypothetical protein